jgi:hypothetical protein
MQKRRKIDQNDIILIINNELTLNIKWIVLKKLIVGRRQISTKKNEIERKDVDYLFHL